LQLLASSEVFEVIKSLFSYSLTYVILRSDINNPRVLQSISSRDSLVGVVFKELSDKILSLVAYVLPLLLIKGEFAGEYSLNDLLVSGTIERRVTTQENIEDNTA
jgi:hypothetical protein